MRGIIAFVTISIACVDYARSEIAAGVTQNVPAAFLCAVISDDVSVNLKGRLNDNGASYSVLLSGYTTPKWGPTKGKRTHFKSEEYFLISGVDGDIIFLSSTRARRAIDVELNFLDPEGSSIDDGIIFFADYMSCEAL